MSVYIILFIMSYLLVGVFRNYALQKGMIDKPNHRSSHELPTPRGGGVMMIGLWLVFVFILAMRGLVAPVAWQVLLPSTLVLSIISYADDIITISAAGRLVCHIGAAMISLYFLGFVSLDFSFLTIANGWISSIMIVFFIVWSINLFNFMDGIDGIAAVEACFVLGTGGLLFYHHPGATHYALLAFALVSIIAGFLIWNKPTAKIFMGDVGSTCLGLIIVNMALLGQKQFNIPVVLWLMLYLCFIYDATITLIRRIINGEKWYHAHRSHAYQRLHQAGWSHSQILKGLVAINVVITLGVILVYYYPRFITAALLMELILLTVIYIKIEKIKPMYENKKN